MKYITGLLSATALLLAPLAAQAEPPSFNYVQASGQHVNRSADSGYGWAVEGSVNPWGGWFLSGNWQGFDNFSSQGDDLQTLQADVGYKYDLVDTVAVYGKVGWARAEVGNFSSDGGHAEVGVRARLPLFQIEGSVGRFERGGGFNRYAATALFHIFPMSYLAVGYVVDQRSGYHEDRWQIGYRVSF